MKALQDVWINFGVGLTIEEYDANNEVNNDTNNDNTSNSSARHHPDDYTVNHETGTILVDRFGHQRVWWGDNDWVLDLVLDDVRYLHTL